MRILVAIWLLASAAAFGQPKVLRRKVLTADGITLALTRLQPEASRGRPVLIVPELGFGGELYENSLAAFLASKGRDVFVLEPRGHGRSSKPRAWRLSQLIEVDLPAAVSAIEKSNEQAIDLVVHGYGGTLVLAACSKELSGKIGRVVALSTPVEAELPNEATRQLLSSGGGLTRLGANTWEMLFARGAKIERSRLERIRTEDLSDLGEAAAGDLLAWMRSGDLALADGSSLKSRLAAYERPTLLVLPLQDNFAHPEFASPLREISKAPVTVRVLSRAELHAEDYSHLSVLLGSEAATDVFAPALSFLDEGTARQ